MDAFFAAVEVLDRPELRGKAVIVGGTPEGHGVVSTASYEARVFGVRSAMPAATAVRLCPDGIFLPPRMARYAEVSSTVFGVFDEVTPLVEPLSIDEAFLDVTGSRPPRGSYDRSAPAADLGRAEAIACDVQALVRERTGGLTCSVGVAKNKFLAKLASDLKKPAGIVRVPDDAISFLAPLPIRRLWGVGPKSAERLERMGWSTIGHLQRVPEDVLGRAVGAESGRHLYRLCRGLDDRAVTRGSGPKSVSQERTFGSFLPADALGAIETELFSMSHQVAFRLRRAELSGRVVTLKVRDETFRTVTRSRSLERSTCVVEEIYSIVRELFRERVELGGRAVRLLGVGVSGLTGERIEQLDFFRGEASRRQEQVAAASDRIEERFGPGAITRGRLLRGEGDDSHRNSGDSDVEAGTSR